MSLWEIFINHSGNLIHKWIQYFPVYERYFSSFRNKSIVFWEIGVSKGGSLQMWRKYFGPNAIIIGIDIDPRCAQCSDYQIQIRIGSQSDKLFLQQIISEFGPPAIVLDDGSHMQDDIFATFEEVYPKLQNNGIYMVEDLHTAYWERYHGGLNTTTSFIEKAKTLVDQLNAYYYMKKENLPEFTLSTSSIAFYDSMVVFEKIARPEPYALKIGGGG